MANDFKKLIAYNLYTDDEASLYQRWLKVIGDLSDIGKEEADLEKARYVYSTMDEIQILYWERILLIPTNLTLPLEERRLQVIARLAGSNNVTKDVKDIISQAFGIDYADIDIIPRNTILIASDPVWNFTYDVRIDPSAGIIDLDIVRDAIERVHAAHCRLGQLVQYVDFWQWDNASRPLDDSDWVTNYYLFTNSGSLVGDIEATTLTDGNQLQIDYFIYSAQPTIGLYARPQETPDLTIRVNGANNITIGITGGTIADQNVTGFTAPVSGSKTYLVYAYDNAGTLTIDKTDTGFEIGDPSSYTNIETDILPICEITLASTDSTIEESNIVDVRPSNN